MRTPRSGQTIQEHKRFAKDGGGKEGSVERAHQERALKA